MNGPPPVKIRVAPYSHHLRSHNPPSQDPPHHDSSTKLRRSSRVSNASSNASGSFYDPDQDADAEGEDAPEVAQENTAESPEDPEDNQQVLKSGRKTKRAIYFESQDSDSDAGPRQAKRPPRSSRGTRSTRLPSDMADFVTDESGDDPDEEYGRRKSARLTRGRPQSTLVPDPQHPKRTTALDRRERYAKRAAKDVDFQPHSNDEDDDDIVDEDALEEEANDLDIDMDDNPRRSTNRRRGREVISESVEEEESGKPYTFRKRKEVNYTIPPPLEEMRAPPPQTSSKKRGKARKGLGWSASGAELARWMGPTPGIPADDSDSDGGLPGRRGAPPTLPNATTPSGLLGAAGIGLDSAVNNPGGVKNLGRIDIAGGGADADPLGVDIKQVNWERVGGLDAHVQSLKELTLLPLLYPELFQKFGVTPPRGVLFHGPPGTGKTLVARALAASCRADGREIAFFMRKGADALSKWVGEAERQLRLLFEEAKRSQPSIIFFDEIDGLAPTRSSKQDQVHASIVSTLLALMDGMDGRGQVVVIGATNRPDAIDPALRRPGRFDREFYFGLPDVAGRKRILQIHTKGWEGWDVDASSLPPASSLKGKGKERDMDSMSVENDQRQPVDIQDAERKEEFSSLIDARLGGLAEMTKGYAGADLRALCTEAALHAIQRRYPQIYKTSDRLRLDPTTIKVGLRDFMGVMKKLVPASARSSTSAAAPLPEQFEPLLGEVVKKVEQAVDRALPLEKRLSALEEAEYEDAADEGDEAALRREMVGQSMQKLRVFRPRVIIHGREGMGQKYVGPAALHHMDKVQVQSLELGSLLSDSSRTIEASIVQLFMEAKRHQPSVLYIPSLHVWCTAVSESARSTVKALLDTLAPSDPILLLGVVDGPFKSLPKDVKDWFGGRKENRVWISPPSPSSIQAFFVPLFEDVSRPPNKFHDGVERRKRVLEELEVMPSDAGKKERVLTEQEKREQEEADVKTLTVLKWRLGPVMQELKRKWKRFSKSAGEEYNVDFSGASDGWIIDPAAVGRPLQVDEQPLENQEQEAIADSTLFQGPLVSQAEDATMGEVNGISPEDETPMDKSQQIVPSSPHPQPQVDIQQHSIEQPPAPAASQNPQAPSTGQDADPILYNIDLERMHVDLYRGRYLTPDQFLEDVGRIVHNTAVRVGEDPDRFFKAQAMYTATQVSMQDFDRAFKAECESMKGREVKRREANKKLRELEKAAKEKDKEDKESESSMVRRSARTHGEQPEFQLTDPAKLERRLKRHRTNGTGTPITDRDTPDIDPGAALSGTDEEEGRDPKRARIESVGMDVDGQRPVASSSSMHSADTGTFTADSFLPGFQSQSHPSPSKINSLLNPILSPSRSADGPSRPYTSMTPGFQHSFVLGDQAPSADEPLSSMATPVPTSHQTGSSIESAHSTDPLPEFRVPPLDLEALKSLISRETADLNIEQLEQLRASCLNCVWRHRKAWDRTEMLVELKRLVRDFLEEVKANEDSDDEDDA